MYEVIVAINRNLKAAKDEQDSLEKVKADIEAYKAERGPEVFACSTRAIDDYWGEGPTVDQPGVCLCRDPDVKPWTRCPVHESPVD